MLAPKEPEKCERDWRQMRKQSLGVLLEAKLRSETSPYTRTLVDIELERRTYIRDRQFDRCVTLFALALSILALIVSVWRTSGELQRDRAAAMRASAPAVTTPTKRAP